VTAAHRKQKRRGLASTVPKVLLVRGTGIVGSGTLGLVLTINSVTLKLRTPACAV
jgi:hypothetical protein